jgi:hypothetical protein
MLISSHGILGYLLYRKSSIRSAKIAALGAIMPDLIFAVALFIAFILLTTYMNLSS